MAKETKIGMKIDEETKSIKKMCEQLGDSIKHEFDKGIEHINVEEMKEAVDMLKDMYEMKEKIVKACYYKQIMEAMEESEYGEDYDEDGPMDSRKGYRGQPRDSRGRYMRRSYTHMMPELERDMDREYGKMYYSGSGSQGGQSSGGMNGGQRGYSDSMQSDSNRYYNGQQSSGRDSREGRSGESRRSYMETKEMHKSNTAEDKQMKMKELEKYMAELSSDVTEMISDASAEEKSLLKQKMQTLISKI